MSNDFVRFDKDEIARILSDLEEIVVSLDRIGSYWSDRASDQEFYEIESRFLSDWDVARKLSRARSILGDAFSRELGSDGMDKLERLLEGAEYWTSATAMDSASKTKFGFIDHEIDLNSVDESTLEQYVSPTIDRDWSGGIQAERFFTFTGLWSNSSLYVFFNCGQNEPVIATTNPVLDKKTIGLWERDVCEIFIAPDKDEPRRYFEFEVAPTGEWLDVAIDLTSGERVPDWNYRSGMQAAARIEDGRVQMAMRIPWEAFGKKPEPGDIWLGNIFRCVGERETRGYLAWQPTNTEKPNFHVPEAFGEFHFTQ